ncbi:GspE/PulE family protein [Photobacterium rosenbergii]|uniref:GspE/PulE family protein n=1 Tax=Photobacterium rosenbergii TaxID=294936 RepID=UPI001C9A1F9C|nr:GspE/PulE family protein [Photobacterium rosenbergii]MBY5947372.1 Flp pilus assembly complex ATPase component TadA [Photobacterium rosenbergii]
MAKKIGQILIDHKAIDEKQLDEALTTQLKDERFLGEILIALGYCSEEQVLDALSEQLSVPRLPAFLALQNIPTIEDLIFQEHGLHPSWWEQHRAFPLEAAHDVIWVGLNDVFDSFVIEAVEKTTHKKVIPVFCSTFELRKLFSNVDTAKQSATSASSEDLDDSSAPVVKFVNDIIQRAISAKASDLHFEIFKGIFRVRFRIDGVMRVVDQPGLAMHAAVVSRLKLMATLDISEKRLPQDGRIRVRLAGQIVDIRMATTPTVHGENIVLRLLNNDSATHATKGLTMFPDQMDDLKNIIQQKNGIFLITGPTGSGKTTSLYTILNELNNEDTKIITVEDPVEYQMAGLTQIQVHSEIGLTFAKVLRSCLRQDPDVMLVGEMRDTETAQIAIQAALTGHLVLSTLHTNDAPSSFIRLKDMGIPDYLIKSSIVGVMAQRLLRTLCPHCKTEHPASVQRAKELGLDGIMQRFPGLVTEPVFYNATGCDHCNGTGYVGRFAVFELLEIINDGEQLGELRSEELAALSTNKNMRTLKEDGLLRAAQGATSLDEVMRVLG